MIIFVIFTSGRRGRRAAESEETETPHFVCYRLVTAMPPERSIIYMVSTYHDANVQTGRKGQEMKKSLLCILLMFLSACSDSGQPPVKLEWVDKSTGSILFTVQDIEVFDWNRQMFKLKPEAAEKFWKWSKKNVKLNRPYLLRDAEGTIYSGELQSMSCSKPAEAPSIFVRNFFSEHPETSYYCISEGFNSYWKVGRYSERLKSALQKAGVLGQIKLPVKLEWVEQETGSVLFTVQDIEVFDWKKQVFKLNPEGNKKFIERMKSLKSSVPYYALKDEEGEVYRGQIYLMPSTCSKHPDGPSIMFGDSLMKYPASPLYTVVRGVTLDMKDHRFSGRLKSALQKAGVLGAINLQEDENR
jgi:hypothetical protein